MAASRPPATRSAARAIALMALVSCLAVTGWAAQGLVRSGVPVAESFGVELVAEDQAGPSTSGAATPPTAGTATPPTAAAPRDDLPSAAPPTPSITPPARTSATLPDHPAPPRPRPVHLSVPSVGLGVEIDPVGVRADAQLAVPDEPRRAGWYRHGPAPGHGHLEGSAVLAGHVDSPTGRGAFYPLTQVVEGDEIMIALDDGSQLTYRVVGGESVAKTDLQAEELFRRDGDPLLRLITCSGAWSPSTGSYTENLVITAVPLDSVTTTSTQENP